MNKKISNKIITSISLLLCCISVSAQNTFRIRVLDSVLNTPIELATIKTISEGQTAIASFTDSLGLSKNFTLSKDTENFIITYIGYKENKLSVRNIAADSIITIHLAPTPQLLAEIKVKGQKAVLERKPDRIIYNINAKNERGKFVSDIMRKIPFVVVTSEEITVKGKTNYLILQNGRQSSLTLSDLQTMQPERVKAIEIITSPSAKYDGECQNVINIILKENDNYRGGVFFAKAGNRANGAGLSYTKTNNKVNTNISFSFLTDRLKSGSYVDNIFSGDSLYFLNQDNSSLKNDLDFQTKYNTEIALSKKDFLGIDAGLYLSAEKKHQTIHPYCMMAVING